MKILNPLTPSQRHVIQIDRHYIWKKNKIKKLTRSAKNKAGRNNKGHIVNRFFGKKKNTINVLMQFKVLNAVPMLVVDIEYISGRSAFISLIVTKNGLCCYILTTFLTKQNQIIHNNSEKEINLDYITIGYINQIQHLPIGSLICNIGYNNEAKTVFARAAGAYATLLKKNINGYCVLKLRSGEKRLIKENNFASIGIVSNLEHNLQQLGKAGRSRWLGFRPIVRGVAMNPVDHPHGGNTSGGKLWTTPWKRLTKGVKTRRKKCTHLYSN